MWAGDLSNQFRAGTLRTSRDTRGRLRYSAAQ